MPAIVNLTAYRGDDWEITGRVVDELTNEPVTDYFDNVTTAVIQVKKSRSDDSVVEFLSNAGEISFNGAEFTLSKANVDTNIPGAAYQYDMQCFYAGSPQVIKTLVRGSLTIEDDITVL